MHFDKIYITLKWLDYVNCSVFTGIVFYQFQQMTKYKRKLVLPSKISWSWFSQQTILLDRRKRYFFENVSDEKKLNLNFVLSYLASHFDNPLVNGTDLTLFPPQTIFQGTLDRCWHKNWLTNNRFFHVEPVCHCLANSL